MPHTADGAPWTHPDTPVGLLLTLGEEAAAWPRQRRQAVKVLLAMRPAAALVAMAHSLHEGQDPNPNPHPHPKPN